MLSVQETEHFLSTVLFPLWQLRRPRLSLGEGLMLDLLTFELMNKMREVFLSSKTHSQKVDISGQNKLCLLGEKGRTFADSDDAHGGGGGGESASALTTSTSTTKRRKGKRLAASTGKQVWRCAAVAHQKGGRETGLLMLA